MSKIIPLRGEGFYRSKADEAYEKGMQSIMTGDYEQALTSFEAAYRFWPKHIEARFYTGLVAYILNQTEKAVGIFEQLHAEHPENYEYTYRYARGLYGKGEVMKAIQLFEDIPPHHEHYLQAQFYRAKALYQKEEKASAVHAFISLLTRFPERADIRFELASIYAEAHRYSASIAELKKCLELDETYVLAYYLLHDIYVEMEAYEVAIDTLETLASVCPKERELVAHNLAILKTKRNQP